MPGAESNSVDKSSMFAQWLLQSLGQSSLQSWRQSSSPDIRAEAAARTQKAKGTRMPAHSVGGVERASMLSRRRSGVCRRRSSPCRATSHPLLSMCSKATGPTEKHLEQHHFSLTHFPSPFFSDVSRIMEPAKEHQRQPSPTAESHTERSQPESSPEACEAPVVKQLTPPPRWPGREFQRRVFGSPLSPEACQKILTTYDYESFQQPGSVILELEKWMGYEGWPFIDDHDRADAIGDKAYDTLHRFLWDHRFVSHAIVALHFTNVYRYYWLTSTAVDGKPRLVISPAEGGTPLPFPDWFTTPFVLPVPHQDFSYKPDIGEEAGRERSKISAS
jgi:hypothetical protein